MKLNNLDIDISPVMQANWIAYHNDRYKIILNQGGTRSGKTYSILQVLILLALTSPSPILISVVSHSLPHLRRGAIRDFITIMENLGLWSDKHFNKSEFVYKYPNRSAIEFFSADDSAKLRGPSRNILFANEVNILTPDDWRQLIIRTTGKAFADYNPVDEFSWVYDKLIPRNDTKFIKSTYLDNYDFLQPAQIDEIEYLKVDPEYWKIYGLGEIAKSTNLIYPNYEVVDYVPGGDVIYGLDFGYNSPTALVEITNNDGNIYVRETIYEQKLTNADLIEKMNTFNIAGNFIYADSEDPQRIEEIYRAGFNIHQAKKNVKAGIDFCKRFAPLYVHRGSIDTLKEIKTYKYKQDKNENILDEPLKFNDHAMDAMRYALYTHGSKYWTNNNITIPKFNTDNLNKKSKTNKYKDVYL